MQQIDPDELRRLAAEMHRMADVSASKITPFFRAKISVEEKPEKGIYDPVTDADRDAEQVIRDYLAAHLPDHGIIGEEIEGFVTASDYQWIIDPIDGTRAFVMGSPLWGTLIGLCYRQQSVLGLMNQPFTGERFWAGPDGAIGRWSGFEGGLQSSQTTSLSDAVLASTCPSLFQEPGDLEMFERLAARCRMFRYGGDCYSYCLLAAGGVDLVVESGLAIYDILPLVPIIEGAGGVITDWQGAPLVFEPDAPSPQTGLSVLAAANRQLHEAALALLS